MNVNLGTNVGDTPNIMDTVDTLGTMDTTHAKSSVMCILIDKISIRINESVADYITTHNIKIHIDNFGEPYCKGKIKITHRTRDYTLLDIILAIYHFPTRWKRYCAYYIDRDRYNMTINNLLIVTPAQLKILDGGYYSPTLDLKMINDKWRVRVHYENSIYNMGSYQDIKEAIYVRMQTYYYLLGDDICKYINGYQIFRRNVPYDVPYSTELDAYVRSKLFKNTAKKSISGTTYTLKRYRGYKHIYWDNICRIYHVVVNYGGKDYHLGQYINVREAIKMHKIVLNLKSQVRIHNLDHNWLVQQLEALSWPPMHEESPLVDLLNMPFFPIPSPFELE